MNLHCPYDKTKMYFMVNHVDFNMDAIPKEIPGFPWSRHHSYIYRPTLDIFLQTIFIYASDLVYHNMCQDLYWQL